MLDAPVKNERNYKKYSSIYNNGIHIKSEGKSGLTRRYRKSLTEGASPYLCFIILVPRLYIKAFFE